MSNLPTSPVPASGATRPLFGLIASAERLERIIVKLAEASTLVDRGFTPKASERVWEASTSLQEMAAAGRTATAEVEDRPGDEQPGGPVPPMVIVNRLIAAINVLAAAEVLIVKRDRAEAMTRLREVQVQLEELARIHRQEHARELEPARVAVTDLLALTGDVEGDCLHPCGLPSVSVRPHTPRGQLHLMKPALKMVGGYEAHESREDAIRAAVRDAKHKANPGRYVTSDRFWKAAQWSALGALVVVAILSVLREAGAL